MLEYKKDPLLSEQMEHLRRFEESIQKSLEIVQSNLLNKGREYASNKSKFHNFEQISRIDNITREQALWGVAMKHLSSVIDIKNNIAEGQLPTQEFLDEKLGDWITYMCLLYASISERICLNKEQ